MQQRKSILFALLTGLAFSIGNYILGNKANLGMLTREASENGSFVYVIVFLLISYGKSAYSNKPFWRWENSNFRNPATGGLNWANIAGLLIYTLISICGGFAVIFTFKFALEGDINQGIITTLFGLSAIFSAILAYVIFGERLKVAHVSFALFKYF